MSTGDLITLCIAVSIDIGIIGGCIANYKKTNYYTDEIVKEETIGKWVTGPEGPKETTIGCSRLFKRTWKNGKITFYEKKFTYKL